jgi:hypothetical protein
MAESIEERVDSLERRVAELERKSVPIIQPPHDEALTPREFLLLKQPGTDNDKTLVAGYFVQILRGKDSFDFDDLAGFYREAKEPIPANRRDPPYQNVRKGFFREVGSRAGGMHARNRWSLTKLGRERVESSLLGSK